MVLRRHVLHTRQFASKDTAGPDPAVNPNAANPFGYVDSDPLTRTDPSGHGWWDDFTDAVSNVWDDVTSAASDAWNWVDDTASEVIDGAGQAWDDASDVVSTAYGDVTTKVVPWVQNHESTIASFAVGAATFVGCTALTEGVGATGCAALAGEATGAVAYDMDCGKTQTGCPAAAS